MKWMKITNISILVIIDSIKFVFDFGDDWRFQCKVLRVIDDDSEYETVIKSVGESPEQYFNYFD